MIFLLDFYDMSMGCQLIESKLKSIEWTSIERKLKSMESKSKSVERKLKSIESKVKSLLKIMTPNHSDPGPSKVTSLKRHLQMLRGGTPTLIRIRH